jgi:hypothetical protein
MNTTTIAGKLSSAIGLNALGSILIDWHSFTCADGTFVAAGETSVALASDGSYSFQLMPTVGASPANSYYTVNYYLRRGSNFTIDHWTVPATLAILTIPQILVNKTVPPPAFLIQASQIYSAAANVGDCLIFNGLTFVPVSLQQSYPFTFTSQSTVSISGTNHGQGAALFIAVYDTSGNALAPAIVVSPIVGDTTISFGAATSGYGFIYGGLGRTLPNFAKGFGGALVGVVKQSEHRFNTPNIAVAVYDSAGNLINTSVSISVSTAFDVTVTVGSAMNFSVVILGAIGSSALVNATVAAVPYTTVVTNATTTTILASVHQNGLTPIANFFDSAGFATNLEYSRDGFGNIIVTAFPAFTGTIQITS